MLYWLFLLLGAFKVVDSLDLPPAATPRSSSRRERPPWGQPTQIRPGYVRTLQAGMDRDGNLEGCPQGEAVEDLEWVVQLKENTMEKSLLGHKYKRSLNTEELYSIANSIAAESRLKGVVRIEQFHGVFKLQYEPREKWLLHRKRSAGLRRASPMFWRRGVERFHRTLASLDKDLEGHPQVEWAMRQRCLVRQKRGFELDFNDPMFNKQWHLVNSKESGHDINVTEVWYNDITGNGVVIAVVDDGLERTNEDIELNYNVQGSYDYNDNDPDPSPNLKSRGDNTHGTKCAGLISAVANNSHCAVGVAHGASVSGIRMLDGKVTDVLEAQSFIHKAHVNWIFSCSWGPEDNGKTVEGPGKLAQRALKMGTSEGRYGYGNIYVFASGNGGQMNDNCNFDGYANSIYTLTVGAVDEKNKMPYYAEPCPSMLAVTYSNGHSNGDRNIVTTDASSHGGCTKSFSGTSAAAPIAAGMVALMLQTRHCLTWRDVQSILVYSAVKVDVSGAEWVENGAGFHHSDQHGFGLMDAYRMTAVARSWPLLPPMVKHHVTGSGRGRSIPANESLLVAIIVPDGNPHASTAGSSSADHDSSQLNSLEYAALTISLQHKRRGDLKISLLSPNSTYSTLSTTRRNDDVTLGLDKWTFTTSRFWGEDPAGVWVLNITDTHTSNKESRGVLKDFTLTLYGSQLTEDEVQERKRLVADVLVEGFSREPLPCPALPSRPKELTLPLKLGPTSLWKVIVVVILAVVGGVLLVHVIMEVLTSRYKVWKRHRNQLQSPSNNVTYSRGSRRRGRSKLEDGSDDEDSDSLETTRLITFGDDTEDQVGHDCDQARPDSIGSIENTHLPDVGSEQTRCDYRQLSPTERAGCTSSAEYYTHLPAVPYKGFEGLRVASPSDSHSTMDDMTCIEGGHALVSGLRESVPLFVPDGSDGSGPTLTEHCERESGVLGMPAGSGYLKGNEQANALLMPPSRSGNEQTDFLLTSDTSSRNKQTSALLMPDSSDGNEQTNALLMPHNSNGSSALLQHRPKWMDVLPIEASVALVQSPEDGCGNLLENVSLTAAGSSKGDGVCTEKTDSLVQAGLSGQHDIQHNSVAENGSTEREGTVVEKEMSGGMATT